ncbi:MAG: FecR domain-containing protein [Prevotellaceae bacterium]|jgi:ferric-dicitrate binding protein FerR (iron transport regulator)|nr:FecR domain-containing protein [Prevotellaceae bacterium]
MKIVDNQKKMFDQLVTRASFETGISAAAGKAKEAVHEEVNERIDRRSFRHIAFRRALIAAASVAAVVVGGYIFVNRPIGVQPTEMFAQLADTSLAGSVSEICVTTGKVSETLSAGNKIVCTGGYIVAGDKKIKVDGIVFVAVPKGKRAELTLNEGTKIWINSGSKIAYAAGFGTENRDIYLNGEAYLEVSKNKKLPFRVHSAQMTVNVTGTKFNVNAYAGAAESNVVLAEGAVEVETAENTLQLLPGQGYFVNETKEEIKQTDIYAFTCWKDGKIKLVDEPFDALMQKLSRYYGIEIISDEALNTIRFDGNLKLDDSLENVVAALALSHDFGYTTSGNTLRINKIK